MNKYRGFLMIVVAILLVVVAALASAFVAMTISGTHSSSSAMSANNAFNLAQSGLEQGSYQLTTTTAWCGTGYQAPVAVSGEGEYQYSCTLNNGLTTATSALTTVSSSVPLASIAGLASLGAVTIDSETMYYAGISGTTLQNVRRGQNGTTAATHLNGAFVSQAQYLISSQGGAPSLSAPGGKVTLSQAVLLMTYFAAGTTGSNGIILNYNGLAWSTAFTGPATLTFRGLYNTTAFGQAVGYTTGNAGSIYTFNGNTWVLATGPLANLQLLDVSCDSPLSPTNCWAVGRNNATSRELMYHSGVASTSGVNSTLNGVSCNSGRCKSVGSSNAYNFLSNAGSPFTTVNTLNTTLTDVDCPSSLCVGIRTKPSNPNINSGYVYYFNGASWSAAAGFQLTVNTPLNAVHCPSTTTCIVVGNAGTIFNCTLPITAVASCILQTPPTTLINLLGVHCNSTTDCLAVGAGTLAYRYTGGVWSTVTLPASYTLNAVSGTSASGMGVTPTVWYNQ